MRLLFIALITSQLGWGSIPTERIVVEGVNVPLENSAGQLRSVQAFPNLQFQRPIFLTSAPDGSDRLFVVEQGGRIFVFQNEHGTREQLEFLDIESKVRRQGNEEGLLGLAFDPDYAQNGFFYVYYTVKSGARRSRISRFQVSSDPNLASVTSEKILLEIPQPYSNHNGGHMEFGPDGKLYISVGDGGGAGDTGNNAQNRTNLLGTILRMDPHLPSPYIPEDNPFASHPTARGEIWAYGLRNVWRFSFDTNGDLWAADVGQNQWEEIDLIKRGGNYGWRILEGNHDYNNPQGLPHSLFEAPVFEYPSSQGNSITGGYVYRGAKLSSLRGAYIYGDYVAGTIWALRLTENGPVNKRIGRVSTLASFGLSRDKELFAISLSGKIFRFEESETAPSEHFPTKLSQTGLFLDTANLTVKDGIMPFDVNVPLWSDNARKRRWVLLPGTQKIQNGEANSWKFPVGTIFIKHFELPTSATTFTRLETRLLVHEKAGWAGYTYRWNESQTDALLISDREQAGYSVHTPTGTQTQTWTFPSRNDCMQCHTSAAGFVLGAQSLQLNRDYKYGSDRANQLTVWEGIDFFQHAIGNPQVLAKLPKLNDTSQSTDSRAKAYLHVNCANCHQPLGPTPTNINFLFGQETTNMNVIDVALTHTTPIVSGEKRLTPRNRQTSAIWTLLSQRGSRQMPPVGSNEVDAQGHDLIGQWIDGQ